MLTNKDKSFISVVIYVYNQEKYIAHFLDTITDLLNSYFEKYEVICVNDASTDRSIEEIKRFASKSSGNIINIINMSFYQGLELSMNAGLDLAIGDFVYEFDTLELSYDISLITDVYTRALEGYDIVSAAPLKGQRMLSKCFYSVFNKAAHSQYILRTETFRLLSRRGINRVHSMSKTIPYRKAVYANCGLRTDTMVFHETDGTDHKSQVNAKQFETALDALILYTDIGSIVSSSFSILMMAFTMLIGIYTAGVYMVGKPVEGWTTTMLFLSFVFFGIFAIMSIIIKYLSIILKLCFNKQKYIIESIEKLNN